MSLRSRIRGGQDYLQIKVATAAQFLTLRLFPIGSNHVGCDDSDGPGHAPRYLDVSHYSRNIRMTKVTKVKLLYWIWGVLLFVTGILSILLYVRDHKAFSLFAGIFWMTLSVIVIIVGTRKNKESNIKE